MLDCESFVTLLLLLTRFHTFLTHTHTSLTDPREPERTLLVGDCGVHGVCPDCPRLHCLSAGTQCKTSAMADIVLLVDGSWSIGRINFKTIRNFIARMVGVFDIGPDRVQIGKTSTPLTAHTRTTTALLRSEDELL